MASKKSEIVRGAGLLTEIAVRLDRSVREAGGGDEDIHYLVTDEGDQLWPQLAQLIVGRDSQSSTTQYALTVDYNLTLSAMIALGRYDSFNRDITAKHFPSQRQSAAPVVVEVTTELVHLNRYVSTEEALSELEERKMRPATLEELLAFGATYPEIQRQFPVVALGSVWVDRSGRRRVPYLWGLSERRNLRLDWTEVGWGGGDRFLAVRK